MCQSPCWISFLEPILIRQNRVVLALAQVSLIQILGICGLRRIVAGGFACYTGRTDGA